MTTWIFDGMTYTCAEPEQIEAWADRKGFIHASRDEAIDANLRFDIFDAAEKAARKVRGADAFAVKPLIEFVRQFCADNPSLVRVLIGDRDPT